MLVIRYKDYHNEAQLAVCTPRSGHAEGTILSSSLDGASEPINGQAISQIILCLVRYGSSSRARGETRRKAIDALCKIDPDARRRFHK